MRDDIICMHASWFPPQYPFLSILILIIIKKKIDRKSKRERETEKGNLLLLT
jgi:hypothetical protein